MQLLLQPRDFKIILNIAMSSKFIQLEEDKL